MHRPNITVTKNAQAHSISAATGEITNETPIEASLTVSDVFIERGSSDASPQGHGLIPPLGARFGTARTTLSGTAPIPSCWVMKNQSATQLAGLSVVMELYVYNANAYGRNDYYVILTQLGKFSPGPLMVNNENQRGYEQYEVTLKNQFQHQDGSAFKPDQVQLIASSPQSTSGVPHVNTAISVPMHLLVKQEGQYVPTAFTAQLNPNTMAGAENTLAGWAVNAIGQQPEQSTGWDYYENATWNPHKNPVNDFKSWWATMYGDHDHVVPLPQLSTSTLPVLTASAWKLDQSLISGGKLGIKITTSVTLRYAAFLNEDGSTSGHHELCPSSQGFQSHWPVDLVSVVDPSSKSLWVALQEQTPSPPYLLSQLGSGSWKKPEQLTADAPSLSSLAFDVSVGDAPEVLGVGASAGEAYLFSRSPSGDWTSNNFLRLMNQGGDSLALAEIVQKTSPDRKETVAALLSQDGKLYAAAKTQAAPIWQFAGQISSQEKLSSIAIGVGNDDYMQVIGLDETGTPYLFWRDGAGAWHAAGEFSPDRSPGIAFSVIAMDQGNDGNLQVIGIAREDGLPHLFWQNRQTAHWTYAGAMAQISRGEGMDVPWGSLTMATGNQGNLQVIGLGKDDLYPYLFWQDNQSGIWNYANNLYQAAGVSGQRPQFSTVSLATNRGLATAGNDLQLMGLGYLDHLAYLFVQDHSNGSWRFAGSIYPATVTNRQFSAVAGLR